MTTDTEISRAVVQQFMERLNNQDAEGSRAVRIPNRLMRPG